jgi:glycosyltransferase involved in cell wall biosynthesis
MYDLYPDALVQAGRVRADSAAARLGAAVTRFALRRCAASVYLGERLRAHAERAYGPSRRTAVIPVGADGEPFKDFPPRPLAPTQRPRILYSGLMGQMHDWETLAEAWTGPEGAELAWAFHASGANYARLRAAAGAPADVVWGGPLADQTWQSAMLEASVALITIAPGAETVVMPSKTYSALVAGQAILAICRRDSDLADLVANHDCGWVVEPGDSADLRRVFGEIIRNPATVLAKRRHAFAAGQGRYDMKPVAELWLRLFAELTGSVGADSGGPTRPATLITPR